MRKILCMVLACVNLMGCLCIYAGAIDTDLVVSENRAADTIIMRASGSFNMSVNPYRTTAADADFPLAAGETVRIRANYTPEDTSVDFGLIDSDDIFHYVNVKTGSIDKTIKVPENGNYTFAVRNNSGKTIRVSGIVNY